MTSINVVFRPSLRTGNHLGSLSLRLIHDRKVKAITLADCRLCPLEWDKRKQTVIYPENDPERTAYLEKLELRVSEECTLIRRYINQLRREGPYTVDDILRLYREKRDDGKLLGYTELLAIELENRDQERTARAYRTVSRGLVRFNRGEDIPLEQIDVNLVKSFERHLKETGKLPNTVSYYMRNLRAIYNKAVSSKRIPRSYYDSPFTGVYTGVTKTMKRALSLDEVKRLRFLELSACSFQEESVAKCIRRENLSRAWRYFFFCFFARGMSFVDMAYLRKDNVQGDVIKYCRKKTGVQVEVRITPELQSIINSFEGETTDSPYLLPIIKGDAKKARLWYENALRVQNSRLKTLANMAGINSRVSTHVARHSWATIGKQKNVPIRVLSDCLGHTSENTTQIYLGMLDNSELDNANRVVTSAILETSARNRLVSSV